MSHLSENEKKKLMQEGKCFVCKQSGHKWYNCPTKKRKENAATEGEAKGDARDDPKGKKPKPSVGLVPDVIGDTQDEKRTALCRTWGKIRDEHCLFFFDNGAKANFISPELAKKLGIHAKEMGPTCDANMANLELS